jgi:hypothetical protein
MAITTKVEVENYLLTAIDPSFDAQFSLWVSVIQEYINSMTNRKVVESDTPVTFKYDGNNSNIIFIDDFRTITEVKVNDTIVDADSDVAKPHDLGYYNQLRKGTTGIWSKGLGNIEVTGKAGMYAEDAIPQDIRFACTVLVAGIVQTSSGENKEIQSETIGRYSVSYKTDAQKVDYKNALEIIKSYRRYSI